MSTGAIHNSSQEDGMRPVYKVSFFQSECLCAEYILNTNAMASKDTAHFLQMRKCEEGVWRYYNPPNINLLSKYN